VPPGLLVAVCRAPGTVIVTVHGDLGPDASAHLEGVLVDLIEGQGNRSVTVELRHANAGGEALAALAVAARRAEDHGASLVVRVQPAY
jgi:hypothetical protein